MYAFFPPYLLPSSDSLSATSSPTSYNNVQRDNGCLLMGADGLLESLLTFLLFAISDSEKFILYLTKTKGNRLFHSSFPKVKWILQRSDLHPSNSFSFQNVLIFMIFTYQKNTLSSWQLRDCINISSSTVNCNIWINRYGQYVSNNWYLKPVYRFISAF